MLDTYKKIKVNNTDLLPLAECELSAGLKTLKCTLMNKVTINGDLGIVKGYIYPHGDVSNIIYPDISIIMGKNFNSAQFINIDHVPHTYVTTSEGSNMEIRIQDITIHLL